MGPGLVGGRESDGDLVSTLVRPGAYSRVLWTPEGWVWLALLPDLVTIECARLDGEVLWSVRSPLKLAHLDADAAPDGSLLAVAQTVNDRLAVINRQGVSESALECAGIQSAVVRWNGAAHVLFSKTAHRTYWRQELGHQPVELPGLETADGWFDVQAGLPRDGSADVLSWADLDRFRFVAGFGLMEATRRGSFWFGQEQSTFDRLVGVLLPDQRMLVHEGLGKYPRLALSPTGEYAATWANLGGTVSVRLMPPWTAWTPFTPVPTPDPTPAPEPEPTPVDCAVSAWSDWSEWAPTDATTEQRIRVRTVVTPPTSGGAACPDLMEIETRAIAPPPKKRPWWHALVEALFTILRGGERP